MTLAKKPSVISFGVSLKNVDIVGCCFFSAVIMYENGLINYHKITKAIIVKIYNE